MRITSELLQSRLACRDQMRLFEEVFPHGAELCIENMLIAESAGLDVTWLAIFLPREGPNSSRAFALWCAEYVKELSLDVGAEECLFLVRKKVENPDSVTAMGMQMAAARAFWAFERRGFDVVGGWAANSAAVAACFTENDFDVTCMVNTVAVDSIHAEFLAFGEDAANAFSEAQTACLTEMLLEAFNEHE